MKKRIVLIVLALIIFCISGCTAAKVEKATDKKTENQIAKEEKNEIPKSELPGKKIKMVKINAPSLEGNLLDEKTEREIGIFLPENYDKETKQYPVVYFLVGYGNTIEDFDNWADLEYIMKAVRGNKKIKDMIFIAVDGQTKAGGSFYVNSPVFGNWENYIVNDVVKYIDNNYRTIKNRNARGLTGHSMGGFGVINIGMKYPDVFGYIYSMNPGLFDEAGVSNVLFFNEQAIEEQYNMTERFKNIDEKLTKTRMKTLINTITFNSSYGMAFSYTYKPPYYEIPYEKIDGKYVRDEEKMRKWNSGFGNMEEKIVKYKDNLLSLGGFVIDYGINDDYPWIPKGCAYFESIMKREGIPCEMRPNEGDHGNLVKERMSEYMAPYFSEKLSFN